MSGRVYLSARAVNDVAEISAYYRTEGGDTLGERFHKGLIETLDRIAFAPSSGAIYAGHADKLFAIRWTRVVGFERHLAFYLIGTERIEILRVLHGARYLDALL